LEAPQAGLLSDVCPESGFLLFHRVGEPPTAARDQKDRGEPITRDPRSPSLWRPLSIVIQLREMWSNCGPFALILSTLHRRRDVGQKFAKI